MSVLLLEETTLQCSGDTNRIFGRSWTKAGKEKTFGNDTLPEKMRVIEALRQIEAQSLNLVVQDVKRQKEDGHHCTAGQF